MSEIREVDPRTLKTWMDEGKTILIDVREPNEHAAEHIVGARLVPLSEFDGADFAGHDNPVAVFHCGSGKRTAMNAQRILATGFKEIYHLDGGIAAWKDAGFPVRRGG